LIPITGPTGFRATGSDAVVLDVEAVDADGRRCPTFIGRCNFSLEGPGIWRGGYNSGRTNSTNHTYLDLESGINRVIVRSSMRPGIITLEATCEGLKPATCTVRSKPVRIEAGIAYELPPVPEQGTLTPLPLPVEEAVGVDDEAAPAADQHSSDLIDDLSYSGPSGQVRIQKARAGAPMFTDDRQDLPQIPASLKGAEYIQLPNRDWNYSAVDLLQFNVKRQSIVYVAHDVRLEKLPWLKNHFDDTGEDLVSGRDRWRLFRRKVKAWEAVLIGSNSEGQVERGRMMTVFVVPE
jgi:beta-galactosidase